MTDSADFKREYAAAIERGLSDQEARDVANFILYGSDVIDDEGGGS